MAPQRRRTFLISTGLADLACFALGSLGYGETWSAAGAIGLMVWLVCIELTR